VCADYKDYLLIQVEAALRSFASLFPMEAHQEDGISLRSHPKITSEALRKEVARELTNAGIQIIEARVSYLGYSSEIAATMLRKQQARAVI